MVSTSSVAEVLAQMESIVAPLPRSDGVACFTRLYLAVTQGVDKRLVGVTFADPVFLARLDVVFANLFLSALQTFSGDLAQAPHAWAPLLEARARRGIAPLQFAFAGMNAHINRDLPVALVSTCRELGITLDEGSPQHADFLRVNDLLATVEGEVKSQYLTGWLRTLDRLVHRIDRLDDIVAMWNVRRARDAAWANAQALWALRDDEALSGEYLTTLDRIVGLAGRGLLVPADTWLMQLGRRLGLQPGKSGGPVR
jgi:hypothetical protein